MEEHERTNAHVGEVRRARPIRIRQVEEESGAFEGKDGRDGERRKGDTTP